ncbi:TPA: LPO_1073/Vpar_1526 family protein [Vibrio parahaemolyticus]
MLGNKQQQKVDSNSTAIQAGGNVSVTQNYGMSVSEVRELCLLFLRDNFPALRDEAIKSAEENVQKFAAELEQKIVDKSGDIVLEKFSDPDVQAAINDAVQASARKGQKANPSVLVDLITERVSGVSNDFKDIVISEAVTVVPKITKSQIAYLSFVHYMTHVGVQGLSHVSQMEPFSRQALAAVSAGFELSEPQKRHLEYAGSCSIAKMMSIDIYGGWMTQLYKYMGYTDINVFKSDIAKFSPTTKLLLDTFDRGSKDGQVTLTSVGQAIAIANLTTTLGKLDYSIWLK